MVTLIFVQVTVNVNVSLKMSSVITNLSNLGSDGLGLQIALVPYKFMQNNFF